MRNKILKTKELQDSGFDVTVTDSSEEFKEN